MASIAKRYGYFWRTLWDGADNAKLKAKRKNPNLLMTGDVVHLPERTTRVAALDTNRVHRFRRKGIPSKICLRLMEYGRPRKHLAYKLTTSDGVVREGKTDGEGYIRLDLQPDVPRGILELTGDWGRERYAVNLGHLDPVDEVTGVQQRLCNLGLKCHITGHVDALTSAVLTEFQTANGLAATGEIDDATKGKLVELHGS